MVRVEAQDFVQFGVQRSKLQRDRGQPVHLDDPAARRKAQEAGIGVLWQLGDGAIGVFVGVIFFVIAFGIINTITMSMAERWHEMGLLRALGTTPWQLATMVLSEAFWLGLVGAIPGALAGWLLAIALQPIGIPLGEQTEFIVTFHEPVRPHPDLLASLLYAIIFTALTVLVSAMSAWRVSRIDPIEAMRA